MSDHPSKANPGRVKVFAVKFVATFVIWASIDPLPLFTLNVTVTFPVTKVKVALVLVAEAKFASDAFVAWIKHVPAELEVMVAVDEELESAQLVAVPPETIANVTAPVPLPPVVVMERTWEYGEALVEVPRDEIERTSEVATMKVKVMAALVALA